MNNGIIVKRTTFECDGIQEPCIIVMSNDEFVKVRISTCYHYFGRNSLFVTEFLDGEFNSEEVWRGDFDSITDDEAIEIAKKYSAYL